MKKDNEKTSEKGAAKQSKKQYSLNDDRRVKVLSPGAMVAKRFFRNRIAMIALFVLIGMFVFSFLGGLGSPAYAAMKAGLMGLTKAYADELGQYGITVNGIAPGYFQTAMTAGTGSGNEEDPKYIKIKEHIPMDRWGERQDLMGAMVFLASKAADYVNGTVLVVDGGYLVR